MGDDRTDPMPEAGRQNGMAVDAEPVDEAQRALIQREAARRLAEMGGTEPDAQEVPRRRFGPAE